MISTVGLYVYAFSFHTSVLFLIFLPEEMSRPNNIIIILIQI